MSPQTLATIMIVLSSLILSFSAFGYFRLYKKNELKNKLKTGRTFLSIVIILFWASMLVGSTFFLQEKEISISVLYIGTYLMFLFLVIQLGSSLIELSKVWSIKGVDGKILKGLGLKKVGLKTIQFMVTSAIMIWLQNWLDVLTF